MPPKSVSSLISGDSSVTPEIAQRLEWVLGLEAQVWLNLQNKWDLFQLRQAQTPEAEATKEVPR